MQAIFTTWTQQAGGRKMIALKLSWGCFSSGARVVNQNTFEWKEWLEINLFNSDVVLSQFILKVLGTTIDALGHF